MTPSQEKIGFCTLCRSRCGTLNIVAGDRLVAVKPAPDHPTGKSLCSKGRAAPEIAHSARRLRRPLRRTNPKDASDPGWVEISWEEALSEVAGRLDHYRAVHGPESVAFAVTSGSSTSISDSIDWVQRFIRVFGSPNTCYATEICNWHKDHAHAFTFGCGLPTPDYANADLILLWGHNPANSWLAQAHAIGEARQRGARVTVIDPRRSGSTRDCDQWLRIRPGTDGALALGLARWLLEHDAFDAGFIRRWSNGPFLVRDDTKRFLRGADLGREDAADSFIVWDDRIEQCRLAEEPVDPDALALSGSRPIETVSGIVSCRPAFAHYAGACSPYTPDRVAQITSIPAGELESLAAAIADAKAVCYYGWTGVGQHTNATQTERAIALLYALTGHFDAPGGNVRFPQHPIRQVGSIDLLRQSQRARALGIDKFPLGPPLDGWVTTSDLYDAILEERPYKVRALFGFGSNLLVSQPNPDRALAALRALEFQVHCDLFLTPTAQTADIVLPVGSPWEREALRVGFEITAQAQELVQLRQRIIQPQGEARSDMSIVFELAVRLGLGGSFFDGDIDSAWDYVLEPLGITVEALRRAPEGISVPLAHRYHKYREEGFATETRRVEVYSELFLRHGYDPVPRFQPPAEARSPQHPYVLMSANSGYFCHSQHRSIPSLRRRAPEPSVDIHPDLARSKGIAAGDWVVIRTRIGSIRLRARLDAALDPAVVASEYGWWQACPDLGLPGYELTGEGGGGNYNAIIADDVRDPISGALPLRSFACAIERATAAPTLSWRPFQVVERQAEAENIVSMMLASADREPLRPVQPGQFLNLRLDGVTRAYSLITPAERVPTLYRVAVRRIPDGALSSRLADLPLGAIIEAQGPSGTFLLPRRNEFPILLIAGGIGITPFMGYLESLTGSAEEPQVILHYGCRNSATHAFASRLAELASRLPNLTVRTHYSQPREGDRCDHRARITAADISDELIRGRARIYLCGPEPMMDGLTSGLLARGVPEFEIFRERFRSPATPIASDGSPRTVRFARSGRTMTWKPQFGTILSCAESAGLGIASGCRVGQCESCAVSVISGEVRHSTEPLGGLDGLCLTCQAIPMTDLVLDA